MFFAPPVLGKTFRSLWVIRIGTLVIDNGGMYLLLALDVNGLAAKCIVNAVIIIINYVVSKLIIFRGK